MSAKVCITGAGRGLGYELTKLFHQNDDQVYPVVRSEQDAGRLVREFPGCRPVVADLTDERCRTIIQSALQEHTDTIDLLINNAGIPGVAYELEKVTTQEVSALFDVHCLGVLRTVQATLEFLQNSDHPTIVNISSRLASLEKMASGEFQHGQFSYSYRIAKAAQNMLTVCMDLELRSRGFRLFAIHPGKIKTDCGAHDADLEPWEAAENIFRWIGNLKEHGHDTFIQPGIGKLPW